jgi:HSF-type DNA-binding
MDEYRTDGEGHQKRYHDYGHVREEDVTPQQGGTEEHEPSPHVKASRGQDKKFPTMLHYILSELEKEGKSDIMGWMPHGRSFIVRDQKRMESEILPKYVCY